ncbi:MAG: hypothetical protein ABSH09_06775 [Bryobacteraceae bacterium]
MRPLLVGLCFSFILLGQSNVVTADYDNYRTSWDQAETLLTPANVNVNGFGKLFSLPVDGVVYAQPLYVSSLSIPGAGTHNVLYVATMHNSVYAFDADNPGKSLWTTNLGPSVPSDAYTYPSQGYTYTDIIPELGILGTPAIDLASNTIFVVIDTAQNNQYSYVLHALDLGSGKEKSGSPVLIQGSVTGNGVASDDGILTFDASMHLQRPGLLVANGHVYVAFGSHGDFGNFHGWVMNYDISTLQQTWVFSTTPNGQGGAIWQSGRGIAIGDDGFLYAVTGNGDYDGISNWGESAIRLDPNTGKINDWFTPEEWMTLNDQDLDFGSAGPILVPGTPYIIAAGKEGYMYVMSDTQLGQLQSGDAQLVSKIRFGKSASAQSKVEPHVLQSFQPTGTGTFNYAFWRTAKASYVFLRASYDVLKAFQMNSDGTFATTPSSAAKTQHAKPFDGITVSSNGTDATSGIVWQTSTDAASQPSSGILHAYQASDVSKELWNSGTISVRDGYGGFVKFVNPTVANGKVYVPTSSNQIVVYGVLPAVAPQTIGSLINGASGTTGPVSPGEIVEIFGNSVGPASPVAGAVSQSQILGNSLAGVQVLFNGVPAPILYGGPNQMSVIAPFEISGSKTVSIQIASGSSESPVFTNPVSASTPALFTLDGSGASQCSCLNQDNSVNGPSNPASPGEVVVLYATGEGLTDPLPQDGAVAASPYPLPNLPVKVTIGGEQAQVLFAGAAPGMVGVLQVNAVVPADAASNLISPVVLTVGGVSSPATVTLAVQ